MDIRYRRDDETFYETGRLAFNVGLTDEEEKGTSKAAKSHVRLPESSHLRSWLSRPITRGACRTCKRLHLKCSGTHCRYYKPNTSQKTVPGVFDFSRVRVWRTKCEATHGGCCCNRHSEALDQQLAYLNLVDVVVGCVVTLPSSTPFVALSYIWGGRQDVESKEG
jgi:hypothetical protein